MTRYVHVPCMSPCSLQTCWSSGFTLETKDNRSYMDMFMGMDVIVMPTSPTEPGGLQQIILYSREQFPRGADAVPRVGQAITLKCIAYTWS